MRAKIRTLGSAGVFIVPGRGNLVGGGKDGILVQPKTEDNLGQDTWAPQFNLPFVATYLPVARTATRVSRRRQCPIPTGQSSISIAAFRHPTGPPLTSTGPPSTWSRRRAGLSISGVRTKCSRHTTTILQRNALPDFEPKGRRSRQETTPVCLEDVLSSPPTGRPPARALSGGCTRIRGPNSIVVHGALVAYDATTVVGGTALKQLFHSDAAANHRDDMGNFAKYSTPVVANGKVYVGTYGNKDQVSNKVVFKIVQYGL